MLVGLPPILPTTLTGNFSIADGATPPAKAKITIAFKESVTIKRLNTDISEEIAHEQEKKQAEEKSK